MIDTEITLPLLKSRTLTNHQTHFGDPIGSWLPNPRFYCMQRTPPTQDLGRTPYPQAAKMSWSVMYYIVQEDEHKSNASSAHIYKVQTLVLRKMHEEFYQHIIVKSACWGATPKKLVFWLSSTFTVHNIITCKLQTLENFYKNPTAIK